MSIVDSGGLPWGHLCVVPYTVVFRDVFIPKAKDSHSIRLVRRVAPGTTVPAHPDHCDPRGVLLQAERNYRLGLEIGDGFVLVRLAQCHTSS